MPNEILFSIKQNTLEYFHSVVEGHQKVASVTRVDDLHFDVRRVSPLSTIAAVVVDVYTLGIADFYLIKRRYPTVTSIVTMSAWNSYSSELKDLAKREHIGVFSFKEFMGALNYKVVHSYISPEERERARTGK